jgi:transposase
MQTILNLGADVDSQYIMVACAAGSFKSHRIANERKAIRAWLRTVPKASRLGMESTGIYHEALADLACQAGLLFIINARDLRRYGQGIGRRGKTDRIDAEVIARYVAREHEELHAYVVPSKEQRLLAQLMRRRAKLIKTKDSVRQSFRGVPALKADTRQLIDHIDRVIRGLELLIKTHAAADAGGACRSRAD